MRGFVHQLTEDPVENAAAVAAAHEVLENWLEENNHGLRIPGNEWGLELKNALHTVLAFTNTGPTGIPTQVRTETMRLLDGLDPNGETEQPWDDRFDRFLVQMDASHPLLEPSEAQLAARDNNADD